jgi:hypothetical protein
MRKEVRIAWLRDSSVLIRLFVEDYKLLLGVDQFRDKDGITPKHFSRDLSRIIAGAENNDLGAGDLAQQTFEIAVCRDQDEVVNGGVVQNGAVAGAGEPVSNCAFRLREQVVQKLNQLRR